MPRAMLFAAGFFAAGFFAAGFFAAAAGASPADSVASAEAAPADSATAKNSGKNLHTFYREPSSRVDTVNGRYDLGWRVADVGVGDLTGQGRIRSED